MGLEIDKGLSPSDFGKILDGHIEEGFQLSHGGLVPGKRGYNEHPTQMEKMHCLAFVISAMVISAMDPDMVKKFKDIRNEARERGLRPIVILTKIDRLCKLTEEDTRNVFNSKLVLQKVEELGKKFGTPANHIFPVRNYSIETECNQSIDILNLRVQRQILRYSSEYLMDKLDLEKADERSRAREVKAQEEERRRRRTMELDRSMFGPETDSEEEAVTHVRGCRAPPPPPYTSRPHPVSPRRSGVLQYSFQGDPLYPEEIASLSAGAVVTEVKPGRGDWTLIETADGRKGKVPSDYVSWKPPGRPTFKHPLYARALNNTHALWMM